jgi:Resolvase, N terminal domain
MTICGYARVSTDGQTLDAQIAPLRAERVLSEKQSGAKTDRAALSRVLAAPGWAGPSVGGSAVGFMSGAVADKAVGRTTTLRAAIREPAQEPRWRLLEFSADSSGGGTCEDRFRIRR